jgi:hypothetical protein
MSIQKKVAGWSGRTWLAKTPLTKEKAVTTDGIPANGYISIAVEELRSSLSRFAQ